MTSPSHSCFRHLRPAYVAAAAARRIACLALAATLLAPPSALPAQHRLGDLDFPTSVDGAARADFLRGLALLHSFEYEDAAEAFRAARDREPEFALAYWGEALTHDHPLWGQEDVEAARGVLAELGPSRAARLAGIEDERERAYFAAVEALFGPGSKQERDVAYERHMRELAEAFPDDEDAAALHALSILATSEGRDHDTYMRAAAVAEGVLADHPLHPGALHYAIHAYDDPAHAPLGLRAARAYAEVAPDAPHALHMPSHIFFALGRWDDLIESNEASWRVSTERVERKGLPASARNFHALFWMHYGYLQAGRREDARRALDIAEASAAAGSHAWTAAEMRAHHIAASPEVDPARVQAALAARVEEIGERATLAGLLAVAYRAWSDGERSLLARAIERGADVPRQTGEAEAARILILSLGVADSHPDSAVAMLDAAHRMYLAEPYVFGPPTAVVKPPAELLGELLINLGRFREAAEAFEAALARAPGRRAVLDGLDRLSALDGHAVPLRDDRLAGVRARALERIAAGEIPSMAITVVERGRVLWSEAMGFADMEAERPATTETAYAIGSMSKSVGATAALTLAEDGRIELDDPVAPALAEIGLEIRRFEDTGEPIRLSHLLGMRAGIPHGWMSLPPSVGVPGPSLRERYAPLAAVSVFPPGEVYHYSNFSTSLPAWVIEGLTGESYSDYVRRRFFTPLAMTEAGTSRFDAPPEALATPYDTSLDPLPFGYQVAAGGAGFHASATDLLQYALFNLGERIRLDGPPVLGDSLLHVHHTWAAGRDSLFSLGWFRGRQMVSNGRVAGGSSWLSLVPEDGVAVICLTNVATSAADQACQDAVGILAPAATQDFDFEAYMAEWETPYEPTADLTGTWTGTVSIGTDELPVAIDLPADGGGTIRIGASEAVRLDDMVFNTRRMFTARAGDRIVLPTPLTPGEIDVAVGLVLRADGDRLYGYVAQTFGYEAGGYRLGSYVALERSSP